MPAELIIAPEALSDLDEAYGWYEAQRAGLGADFLGRVDACLQAILRFPEMHHLLYENYRRALIRRFPYAIFYEFVAGTVTVYSVFQTSQNPNKWRHRLL